MNRKRNNKRKPLQLGINTKVLEIIEDPDVIAYVALKIIRNGQRSRFGGTRRPTRAMCSAFRGGYTSPRKLIRFAGMSIKDISGSAGKPQKLARVSATPLPLLKQLSYFSPTGSPWYRQLLGHRVLPQDTCHKTPSVCLTCVREKAHVEAHWDLTLMYACPIHGAMGVKKCNSCQRPLRWFRRGLLLCECGANLDESEAELIGDEEAALLDVIRCKLMDCRFEGKQKVGLPASDLLSMHLGSILLVTRTLSKCLRIADGTSGLVRPRDIVIDAARVFSRWPNNFFELLEFWPGAAESR